MKGQTTEYVLKTHDATTNRWARADFIVKFSALFSALDEFLVKIYGNFFTGYPAYTGKFALFCIMFLQNFETIYRHGKGPGRLIGY